MANTKTLKEVVDEEKALIDEGDKVSASLSFKKNLGNYQSMDFYAGTSLTKRDGESDEDVWHRAWKIVEDQLDEQVAKADGIIRQPKQ